MLQKQYYEIICHFNELVEKEITSFIYFLDSIKLLKTNCKLLARIQSNTIDHMIKEEKYYLYRIRRIAEQG
ncbi:MAG TPA: hypothetical protein DGK91_08785 [Clostridium sp.]|nr:DUF2935 domain-containing protein [Clostridia bacterium]HCW04603.1 hypothetical protein [Clostridium sp.]